MADAITIDTDNAEVAAYARDGRITGTFEVSLPGPGEIDPPAATIKLTYDE